MSRLHGLQCRSIDGVLPHAPRVRQEWEILQAGDAVLQNSGARISHDQADRAFYNRISDSIHLPLKAAFKSAAEYYGTALHELSHWTGHPTRLNRETLNETYSFGDLAYAKEELRAELASVFLMAERGIPHNPDSHAAYLSSWLHALRNDKSEIFRAARAAHKAAHLLIALEFHKSIGQALAHVNGTLPAPVEQTILQQGAQPQSGAALFECGKMSALAAKCRRFATKLKRAEITNPWSSICCIVCWFCYPQIQADKSR